MTDNNNSNNNNNNNTGNNLKQRSLQRNKINLSLRSQISRLQKRVMKFYSSS